MTTYTAVWNGQEIARSDRTLQVEGNQYFPADSVVQDYLAPSDRHTTCPWKGEASYYDLVVHAQTNSGAAWYYPDPSPAAEQIRGHIAFWQGVTVRKVPSEDATGERPGVWQRICRRMGVGN